LRPLFPFWYTALQREAQIRTAMHHLGQRSDLQAALEEAMADERTCDEIAADLFRRALDQIKSSLPEDLCDFALRLRQEGLERTSGLSCTTQAQARDY